MPATKTQSLKWICSLCNGEANSPRLPGGWKRVEKAPVCRECLKKRYIVRAISLPIAECVGVEWKDFCQRMHEVWRKTTDLANWTVGELFRREKIPVAGEKLGPMPTVEGGYYNLAFTRPPKGKRTYPNPEQWDGAATSACIVIRGTEQKYRKERFEVIVRRQHRLLTYQYPQPFPVDADQWRARFGENKTPLVEITLPGGRVTLRLKREASLGWQLSRFAEIVAGNCLLGEAAIYRNRSKHLMLKLVARIPRSKVSLAELAEQRVNTCLVRTGKDYFLAADVLGPSIPPRNILLMEDDPLRESIEKARLLQTWTLNYDHLKRWFIERERYLDRTSEDLKHEKRLSSRARRNLLKAREVRLVKMANRIKTAMEEASKQVAEFCMRQKIAVVVYDDRNREFAPRAPWYALGEMLTRKLEERGIETIVRKCVADDKASDRDE